MSNSYTDKIAEELHREICCVKADVSALSGSLSVVKISDAVLLVTNWVLVGSLYEYSYANVNITADSIVDVIPKNDTIDIVTTAEILPYIESLSGEITIYSKSLPSGDINVAINIYN